MSEKARSIIKQYGFRSPIEIDVEAIAALRGAFVREETLEGCDGRLIRIGSQGIIAVKTGMPEEGRKRFTIAHELGHFELHALGIETIICVSKDFQAWAPRTNTRETEANQFAAELLMPESMFKPLCQNDTPSLDLIEGLAKQFRTSLTATALRYITFSPYRCAIIQSKEDKIEWSHCTESFGYRLENRTPLDLDCLATDFFKGNRIVSGIQPVVASSWIRNNKIGPLAFVKEQSWGFKTYGTVLSLLWLDTVFEKEEEADEDDYY